jgi:hypothetical protein
VIVSIICPSFPLLTILTRLWLLPFEKPPEFGAIFMKITRFYSLLISTGQRATGEAPT